jgi:protein phosphatase
MDEVLNSQTVIRVPTGAMVLLVGPTSSGKSTFAAKHFKGSQIQSSDFFRQLVADDAESGEASDDAFAVLHDVVYRRLARRLTTVVDASNLQREHRGEFLSIAKKNHAPVHVIAFDVRFKDLLARNAARPNPRKEHIVQRHHQMLRSVIGDLKKERHDDLIVLTARAAEAASIEIVPSAVDFSALSGPFDVIGDVHGCYDELLDLLDRMGWRVEDRATGLEPGRFVLSHPESRRLVFVGDLVDRGPKPLECVRLVMDAVASGVSLCVPGNHDDKFMRWLQGRTVTVAHGLEVTVAAAKDLPSEHPFRKEVIRFFRALPSHVVLDGGKLVVAHAGLKESLHGRAGRSLRDRTMYGETTGEEDENGLPIRSDWAADYEGKTAVVYGHTPCVEAVWRRNTIDIDLGCAFGGALAGLRWPERDVVTVLARQSYAEAGRPMVDFRAIDEAEKAKVAVANDARSILEGFTLETRSHGSVKVMPDMAAPAFEVMARFCHDPRWLCFMPPTTATVPAATSGDVLERVEDALQHFVDQGDPRVCIEEKHMGSRATVVIARSAEVAKRRFGDDTKVGVVHSRHLRPFFPKAEQEAEFVARLSKVVDAAGLWSHLDTDWLVLDGEVLPWSAKAETLLRDVFAATATAGLAFEERFSKLLFEAGERGVPEVDAMFQSSFARLEDLRAFRMAYRPFCEDGFDRMAISFAPFRILASEGRVLAETPEWHLSTIQKMVDAGDGFVTATRHRVGDPNDDAFRAEAVTFMSMLETEGKEGVVVKPTAFMPGNKKMAPAMKVRGSEYLRLIYGPHYLRPENIDRLRKRNTRKKLALARQGLAASIEAMERFVAAEGIDRVREALFAAMAVSQDRVDPRL